MVVRPCTTIYRPSQAAIFVLVTAGVLANQAYAGSREDAERAIQRGVELRKRSADQQALEEFQKAFALDPSPRAAAQIGLAYQALGRWQEAEEQLTAVLQQATDSWVTKNRSSLDEALRDVQAHVGSLDVIGSPAGATVRVEGRRVGVLPLPHPVRASVGIVSLEVQADGYLPVVRNVSVSAEYLARETVNLTPTMGLKSADGTSKAPSGVDGGVLAVGGRTSMSWMRTAAWIASGGAILALGTGVVFHVAAAGKFADFNRSCGVNSDGRPMADPMAPGLSDGQCASLFEDWNSDKRWAIVGYATGTAFALTAALLFVTSSSKATVPENRAYFRCRPAATAIVCGAAF